MVYTVEFQKWGLPHMHLLLFLHQDDKIREPKTADDVVSAQIPDPVTQPLFYETVTKNMEHVVLDTQKPSVWWIRLARSITLRSFKSRPSFQTTGILCMPDQTMVAPLKTRRHNPHDNRDIIPYNPYLVAKYGWFFFYI
jgi:hypothetical protein